MSVATSDIVAELRRRAASSYWAWSGEAALYGRAADEIEQSRRNEGELKAEIERLRADVGRLQPADESDLPARLAVATETCRRYEEWALADLLEEARGRLESLGV
jgi:hypothetical protein